MARNQTAYQNDQRASHAEKVSRKRPRLATLEPFFRQLLASYHQAHWLSSDPIQYPHQFAKDEDREVVAFLSACFAYGSVVLIHRAVKAILEPMGPSPAKFVRNFDGVDRWPGFYHRFHTNEHLVLLVKIMQRAMREHGSIGGLFQACEASGAGEMRGERVLNGAARWLQERSREVSAGRPDLLRGMLFFFNAPEDGSACKRMTMFLRWMVRADHIDFGLWRWLDPADLIVPADTHVARIAYYLRLRGGKENSPANWKMAKEITASLRELNAKDPVSYDFALARLGILDICKRKYAKSVCERCPVSGACRFKEKPGALAGRQREDI